MINFICGEIVEVNDGYVVLRCNGIGYELFVSNFTLTKCKTGKETQLLTHMAVKEDGITLFGFAEPDEKRMFLKLTCVSGVGAKTALAVLSGMTPKDLCVAFLNGDITRLTRIKGLGKKTAERIILELRGSVVDSFADSLFEGGEASALIGADNEAASVLVSLGLNRSEALSRVKGAVKKGLTSTEDIVNYSLKNPDRDKA